MVYSALSMALERLTPQVTDEILKQTEFANPLEELRKETSIGMFFDRVNDLAIETYFSAQNEIFSRQRNANQGDIPLATIEKAIRYRDFGTVGPDNPMFRTLTQAVAFKEQIKRDITRHILSEQEISGENPLGLTASERIVLLGSLDLADEFDDFYIEYNDYLMWSPAEKRLREMGKEAAKTLLMKEGLITPDTDFMYAVFEQDDDHIVAKSYFDVFSPQIHRLGRIMIDMAEKLEGIGESDAEAIVYRDYFRAFKYALFSTNPDQQEKLWAELDEKWMKITGRVQPIHPMETYNDFLRYRVEPAYVLAILDDRYPKIHERMRQTRDGLVKFLMQRYGQSRSMISSETAVRNSQAGFYSTVISGARLAFMFAGENVPNREKVRLKGSKIFLVPESFRNRWKKQIELLELIHRKENVASLFPDVERLIEEDEAVLVAGHEPGHNGFLMDGTRKTLGPEIEGYVEENKTDLTISASVPDLEHLNLQDKHDYIRNLYASNLRRLLARNDHQRQAYFNSALFFLNAMIESGILTDVDKGAGKVGFHPEDDRAIGIFAEKITTALDEMHQVYDKLDPNLAKTFTDKYYRETEGIKQLEQIIGVDTAKPR